MEPSYKKDLSSNNQIVEVITTSREETAAIGAALASLLHGGDILCLDGDLGAGKTAFTAGIAKGLGICGVIASPTFTILMEHTKHIPDRSEKLPLFHFDAYRLYDEDDFYNLGFDEYFSYGGICVIEWADRIRSAIPPGAIWITLHQGSADLSDQRLVTFSFSGEDMRAKLFFERIMSREGRNP